MRTDKETSTTPNRSDLPDELEQIEALALSGDTTAQIYLGWAYTKWGNLGTDANKAEKWLQMATDNKSIEGARRLARFLCDEDRPEAVKVAEDLVSRADFYGDYLLGHILLNGSCGIQRDPGAALRHLKAAAEKGHLISRLDYLRELDGSVGQLGFYFLQRLAYFVKLMIVLIFRPKSITVYR